MIVVTGAAGFIGSNVVAALNDAGRDDIVACDRLGQDDRWQNLRKRMFRNFVFPEQLHEFLAKTRDVEAIVHMGAISSTTARDGDAVMRDNFQFSLALLDTCASRGIPLIYASSAATYGDGSQGFTDDLPFADLRNLRPLNLYGWSKHQFDLVVAERRDRGLPLPPRCVGLKFFNVFGPNEYHKGDMMSVVAKNHGIAAAGGEVQLFRSHRSDFADGGQRRDFVLVDDVADVVVWALGHGPACGLLNVGTGQATSFRDLIGALFEAVGHEPRIAYIPMPEALRDRYQYATEAPLGALRNAGYRRPFTPVREAVARYAGFLGAADRYR